MSHLFKVISTKNVEYTIVNEIIIRVRTRKIGPASGKSNLLFIASANAIAPRTPANHRKNCFLKSKRESVRDIFANFVQTKMLTNRENSIIKIEIKTNVKESLLKNFKYVSNIKLPIRIL